MVEKLHISWGNLQRLLGSSQGLLKTSLCGSCKNWVGTCCLCLSITKLWAHIYILPCSLCYATSTFTGQKGWYELDARAPRWNFIPQQKLCCRFSFNSLVDERWKHIQVKMPCKAPFQKTICNGERLTMTLGEKRYRWRGPLMAAFHCRANDGFSYDSIVHIGIGSQLPPQWCNQTPKWLK